MNLKRNLARIGLVLILVFVGVFLYNIGKENTLYIDNKEVTLDGKTYPATVAYRVWIDGEEIADVNPDRRNMAELVGAKHKLALEVVDENGNLLGQKFEKSFSVKKNESILNLPAVVGEADGFVLPPEVEEE